MGTVKHYVNQDRFQADLWVLDTMIFLVYAFSCVVHHYFNDSEEWWLHNLFSNTYINTIHFLSYLVQSKILKQHCKDNLQ